MAIIIPSKNIYEMNNPKVRDNLVNNVSVERTVVSPDNEYETPVYNETLPLNAAFSYDNSGGDTQTDNSSSGAGAFPVVACGTIIYDKYVEAIIKIKRTENNKYITKIYNQNREGSKTPYTQIAKNFEEKTYYYQVDNSYIYDDAISSKFDFETIKSYSSQKENLSNQTISGLRDLIVRFNANDENGNDYDNRFVSNWATPTITAEGTNNIVSVISAKIYGGSYSKNSINNFSTSETNLGELNIDDSDDDYITITIPKIFIGRTIYATSTAIYTYAQASHSRVYPSKVVEIQQNVVRAEITIYGNTIGIDLTDGSMNYTEGSGNKPFSLSGNELLQDSATTKGVATTKWLADNILREYKTGKETAVIRCSVYDRLPSQYQELEYIESQGEGYILTDYVPNDNSEFEIDFVCNSELVGESGFGTIFGSRTISKNNEFQLTSYSDDKTKHRGTFRYGNNYYEAGIVKGERMTASFSKRRYRTSTGVNIAITEDESLSSYPLAIFALNENGTIVQNGKVRLYSFTIKENGIAVRNFIPCYDKEDKSGYVGLYDTITKNFYKATSLSFIREKERTLRFNVGERVIPMVYGADGQDHPMSLYKDGTPKEFVVVGTKIFYDGAVWQELTLQELPQKNN